MDTKGKESVDNVHVVIRLIRDCKMILAGLCMPYALDTDWKPEINEPAISLELFH